MKNTLKDLGWDTGVVLFFLAVEVGRTASVLSLESSVMLLTGLLVLVLPFFLLGETNVRFCDWILIRGVVALAGGAIGAMLPDPFKPLPMTFLIVAAMVSCYIQFYGLVRLRPVK
jgi:hypothetical protein